MKHYSYFIYPFLFFYIFLYSSGFSQWVNTGGAPGRITNISQSGENLFAASNSGAFLSTDDGLHWKSIGLFDKYVHDILGIENKLFAATDSGVFLSIDTGKVWKPVNNGLIFYNEPLALTKLVGKIFLGTGGNGVSFSTDYGSSWKTTDSGIWPNSSIYSLAVDGQKIIAGSAYGTIFQSTNEGLTWSAITIDSTTSDTYLHAVLIKDSNLYAGSNRGGFRSTNGGKRWETIANGVGEVTAFAQSGNNLFMGLGNVLYSTNNGDSWSMVSSNGTDFITCTALSFARKYLIVGDWNGFLWRRPLVEMIPENIIHRINKKPILESFPNPLSTKSTISFSNEQREYTTISIVDMLGKECAHLFSGDLDAGEHSFEWDASHNPPGMYLCVIHAGGVMKEIPLIVVR
jgi:hypothetical protein